MTRPGFVSLPTFAVFVLIIAAPVSVLLLTGDAPGHAPGGAAAVVALGAVLVLVFSRITVHHVVVPLLLVPAGLIAVWAYRMITTPTIGANIGAGLAMIFLYPLSGLLVVTALSYGVIAAVRGRRG